MTDDQQPPQHRDNNPGPLPAPPGSGEVRGNDPFPGVVESLENIQPKRDNGSDGGKGYVADE